MTKHQAAGPTPEHQLPHPALRPAPRLRTNLIAILVSMLGIACLIIGVSSYLALSNSLMERAWDQLNETAHRAVSFKPNSLPNQAAISTETDGCSQPSGRTLLDAPGQGPGTLALCTSEGQTVLAGLLDFQGATQPLSDADQQTLLALSQTPGTSEVDLEAGDYLIHIQENPITEGVVITGVPLTETHRTLTVLVIVIIAASLAVMIGAGVLGSLIIRRTMQPLERVSQVAAGVANLDLALETLPEASRVQPADAHPGDEVGAVGYALNQLLDNVQTALEARSRTEEQMRVFVADASHELRTPLAAIKGYTELIRWTEKLSDQGKTSLERVNSQTERMSSLVEDLLLLVRLDEGRAPEKAEVDLTELLLENVMDLQVAAPSHTWKLRLPEELVYVLGDKTQIQQVILNLLSNARKHTDPGTQVTASLSISAGGQDAIISVMDQGPGIAPDFQEKIFDRFTRADSARSGSDGTTGLGLPIAKAIVEAHGGRIDLVSSPGRTEFTVRLPLLKKVDA